MKENMFSISNSPEILNRISLPSFKNNLILMHPSDMKRLKCEKNHLVTLSSDGKAIIFRSSPCLSITPASVILPAFSLLKGNLKNSVTIEACNQELDYADRIILIFDKYKSFMKTKNFQRYLQANLNMMYLAEDLTLYISYLGYNCHCVIKKIIGSRDEIANKESINDDSLILRESTLDCSFVCSTPKNSKACNSLVPENIKNANNRDVKGSSQWFYVIHQNTNILIKERESKKTSLSQITSEDICGLNEQIKNLKSLMISSINQSLKSAGNCPGIILIGASGTGKSIAVQALANEFRLPVISLKNISSFRNKEELKTQIRNLFKEAEDNTPSILFLDDIDSFCKDADILLGLRSRSETVFLFSRMIYHLLNSRNGIIVIGAAHDISDVDPCMRKPGLLETEIYFGTPAAPDRKEILSKILSKMPHTLNQEEICEISERTHGFTGGDLKLLVSKGIISSQLRIMDFNSFVNFEDIKEALKEVKPSAMTEFRFEVPKIKWNDIGGMHTVKKALAEMINLKFYEKLKEWKMPTHRGILLYGPPGCSKTMIAAALASESNFNFISVKGPELFRKYVGESESAISQLFMKARSASPCIIFFDEIDTMSAIRGSMMNGSNVADRLLNQLLVAIDGIDVLECSLHIIAATNRPEKIDESLLRPGRFDKLIYVPLPDSAARKEIMENYLRRLPVAKDISVSDLVNATAGYTGAEIVEVFDEATSYALEDAIESNILETNLHAALVTRSHFHIALEHVKPKTTKDILKSYEDFEVQRKCNVSTN